MLTQERLKEVFSYDPESGNFTRVKPLRGCGLNEAGHLNKGYLIIGVDRRGYSAHRLAFLYMTGSFPSKYVDHIDGNKSNNAWNNLREATQSQNQFNTRVNTKSKTGLKGAYLHNHSGLYVARTKHEGKRILLGYFKTAIEAKQAYDNFHSSKNNTFFRP
jgi:hypothetical protein